MKKFYTGIIFSIFALCMQSQSLSFGVGLMPRFNYLQGINDGETYVRNAKPQFSALDLTNDTLNFHFTNLQSVNNLEIPFYLRYKTKKRWSFDLGFSTSKFTIQMDGKTNYSDNTLRTWTPEQPFIDSCTANNLTYQQAEQEYSKYIDSRYNYWENNFSYKEEIKIRTFSLAATYSFLPHKSFKPFIQLGFSVRHRVSNYSFQHFDMENVWIRDQEKVTNGGIDAFPKNLFSYRFGTGVETYRFRAGFTFDYSSAGNSVSNNMYNDRIINKAQYYPYSTVTSVGIYLSADLITYELAAKKQIETNSNDLSEIPKIKAKQDRWSIGMRCNNSMFNQLDSYYSEAHPLNIYSQSSVYDFWQHSGPYPVEYYGQMETLKSFSLVDFRPQGEFFFRRNFLPKIIWESTLGYSVLKTDIATREFKGRIYIDANNVQQFDVFNSSVYSGVYRSKFGILSVGQNFGYEFFGNDFIKLRVFGGVGISVLAPFNVNSNKKEGVNSSDVNRTFDSWYANKGAVGSLPNRPDNTASLYLTENSIPIDISGSPDSLFNSFSKDYSVIPGSDYTIYPAYEKEFKTKEQPKFYYSTYRFGLEAEVNRFILGAFYEGNLGYMDGVLLKKYKTFSISVGYVFLKR